MNHKVTNLLDTFKTTDTFAAKYAADFPATTPGGQQFALIHTAVTATANLGANQTSGGEQQDAGNLAKVAARFHLHQDLLAITDAAHTLVLLGTAGLDGKFHMPRSAGDQALLNTARAYATDAVAYTAALTGLGLPADFITHLTADVTAFESAATAANTGQLAQASATGGMEDTAHKAATALHILQTIVRNKYKNDPAKLAEWTVASHVEKHTPVPKPPKTTPPPTP
jgi:hypothetical protein